VAIAEAIRRFQWNFFRVENEHLANHQMMKDIPLPYSVDPVEISDDDGDEDDPVPVSSTPMQRQEVWFSTFLIGVYGLLMGSLWALMALISTYTVEMV
jgi:EXS family